VCSTINGPLPNDPLYAIEVLRNGVWHEGSEDIFSRDWMDKNLAEQYLADYLKRSQFNAKNFRVIDFANQYQNLPFVSPNNPEVFYVQLGASGLVAGTSHVNAWKFYPNNESPEPFDTVAEAWKVASKEVNPSTPWKTVRIISSIQGLVQITDPIEDNESPAHDGLYIRFSFDGNENLVITPTAAGVEEATDRVNENDTGDDAFWAMIEDHLGNGWDVVRPEEIGAMTDALLITNDIERDNIAGQDNIDRLGSCWSNIDHYQTTSEVAEFAEGRSVTWRKIQATPTPSNFEVQYKMTEEGTFWNREGRYRSLAEAQARIRELHESPEQRRARIFVRIIDAVDGSEVSQTVLEPAHVRDDV
jgi:hypothetical protein